MSRAPASRSTGSGGGVAQVCLGVVSGVCDGGAGSPGARGGGFFGVAPVAPSAATPGYSTDSVFQTSFLRKLF